MTAQLDMFAAPAPPARGRRAYGHRKPTLTERFESFHKANRHVLDEMLRLAQARLAAGERRIGVKALWEELRSSLEKIADGGLGIDGKYKLNNSYTSSYARLLIKVAPALADVIEIRRRRTK